MLCTLATVQAWIPWFAETIPRFWLVSIVSLTFLLTPSNDFVDGYKTTTQYFQ
jgi:hypothetical protein